MPGNGLGDFPLRLSKPHPFRGPDESVSEHGLHARRATGACCGTDVGGVLLP